MVPARISSAGGAPVTPMALPGGSQFCSAVPAGAGTVTRSSARRNGGSADRRRNICAKLSLCGPANGQALDQHGRLPDADGDALTGLAAGADTGIERHVIADRAHLFKRLATRADQRCALDRRRQLAILDEIGLRAAEDE